VIRQSLVGDLFLAFVIDDAIGDAIGEYQVDNE
jgi:hypothetical protein